MGAERLSEASKIDAPIDVRRSIFTIQPEDYRQYKDRSSSCYLDSILLPELRIVDSSGKRYESPSGTVSVDAAGAVSIDKNCRQVFSYSPQRNETFVWTGDKSNTTLSEVRLPDGSKIRFNAISNNWQTYNAQGQYTGEQRYHHASMKVSGMTITLSLSGPITPERLHAEYQKLQRVFVSGETAGLIPFSEDQLKANLARIRDNEGFETKPYKDSKGIWTIGVGLNLEDDEAKELLESSGVNYKELMERKDSENPLQLSQEQAEKILRLTTLRAVYECKTAYPGYDRYPQHVKEVLLDLMFNMGPETLSTFTRFNSNIKNGTYKDAADLLLKSAYANQVGDRAVRNADKLRRL